MATYQVFNFPLHFATHSWPAGDQVQFGRGYVSASEPDRPLQRLLTLKFSGMLFIKNPYTGVWLRRADTRSNPTEAAKLEELKKRAIWCLDDFYDEHLLHKKFYYDHYVFGRMVVRFQQAFQMPDPLQGNRNVENHIPTNSFEVRLLEHPE